MIFFNKKFYILILLIFVIYISSFIYNYIIETIETSSTPVSNHIIVLDAGHGFPDGGATNASTSIIESDLNLEIVLKLLTPIIRWTLSYRGINSLYKMGLNNAILKQ